MSIWLEKDIEKRYVSMATALGNICIKMNVIGAKSRPDRLVLLKHGGVIWIEFKQPGKGLYPQQAWFQRELHKRQQIVETFDNEHYAIQFTQACMEASRLSGGGGPAFSDPSLFGPTYGSRPRKDVYDAYNIETPEALRRQQEDASGRSVKGLLQCLAKRGGQVGEFLYLNLDDNTRC